MQQSKTCLGQIRGTYRNVAIAEKRKHPPLNKNTIPIAYKKKNEVWK